MLPNRKLTIDAFLRDIEVLHVEEAIFANTLNQRLGQLLLALRSAKEAEVDSDEVSPIKLFLQVFKDVGQ